MKILALSFLAAIISCAALEAKASAQGEKHGHGHHGKHEKKGSK